MKPFDVVIVGAGPAGASAAAKASELSLRTLLIERRREIGVPVQCGEYMPHEDEVNRMFSESKHTANLIELTKVFQQNECDSIRLITPSGSEYNLTFHAYVIDREGFNKELANRAERNGCEIWLNTVALEVNVAKSELILERSGDPKSVSFKVLIAADGFNSNITQSLGLKTTTHENKAFTIHSMISEVDIEANVCEMYWNKDYSPGGYAWIIPKGKNVANVGLGIRGKFTKERSLKRYLTHFIYDNPRVSKKLGSGKVLSTVGGGVPVGGPISKTFYKNVLIVGDAAGQVAAHVGGGVPSSVICGEIASENAHYHIERGAPLSEYERSWKKELGAILEKSFRLRKIGDIFIDDNKLIDLALNTIGEEELNKLIRCEVSKGLETVLSRVSSIKQTIENIKGYLSR